MARFARRTSLLVAALALLGAAAGGLPAPARAQEPAATLVITQPTPTATPPSPGAQAGAVPAEQAQASPYVVQEGDTLLDAALELGLDVEEMGCVLAPDFDPARPLVIGDALPPLPGGVVCHRVAPGETLAAVARRYGTTAAAIARLPWNGLPGSAGRGLGAAAPLRAGRYVRVPVAAEQRFEPLVAVAAPQGAMPGTDPAGFLALMLAQPVNTPPQALFALGGTGGVSRPPSLAPVPADWPYGSGLFTWPAYGWLTQGYRRDHRALDIAAPTGAPVTAADRGVVVRAGWNDQGYGNFVIVDHNIDYLTLYAHLDEIFVRAGEVVGQGQVLGTVGSTGNSTGPHLHFEIRDFGRLINPLELLAR